MSGCPECDWPGEVATTHDRQDTYYHHVTVDDGTLEKHGYCTKS